MIYETVCCLISFCLFCYFIIDRISKKKMGLNSLLIFSLICIMMNFIFRRRFINEISDFPLYFKISSHNILVPAVLYLYIKLKINLKLIFFDYLHFSPFIILNLINLSYFPNKEDVVYHTIFLNPTSFKVSGYSTLFFLLFSIIYFFYSLWTIKLVKQNEFQKVHITIFENQKWIEFLLYYFFIASFIMVISIFIFKNSNQLNNLVYLVSYFQLFYITLFIALIIYFIKMEEYFDIRKKEEILQVEKYLKSGISPDHSKNLFDEIKILIESEELFLNEELRISDISKKLNTSVNIVSQALNENSGKNFYQFINEYRVNSVINKFKSDKFKNHSILRIALDSGFNSKSAFNKIFKQITGENPSSYRKK